MQLSLPLGPNEISRIRDLLLPVYGPQRDSLRHDPNEQFFKAMLSARTRDAISSNVFQSVRSILPSWDALARMDPAALFEAIRSVTFAEKKAGFIIQAARLITAYRGRFDLSFLANWPVEDASAWLQQMPGIGSKTAAVILNFSTLRKRTFAIDTHVLRILKRLGLVGPKGSFDRAFKVVTPLIPNDWDADDLYELHWLMKLHGQTICSHGRPDCGKCPLIGLCRNPPVL